MKKKTTKKFLLPVILLTLCFTFIKAPKIPQNIPADAPVQILPCSDFVDERDVEDE